ncbi:hypothetical protein ABIA33_007489 [Streptacidiphilus sp. MAP12-16]
MNNRHPQCSRRRSGNAVDLSRGCPGLPLAALLIPLTTSGAGTLLYVTAGICVSAGVVAGNVIKASFQQSYCPPDLLGRLTASTAFLNYGTIPIGAILAGALGTLLGLPRSHVDHNSRSSPRRSDPPPLPAPQDPGPADFPAASEQNASPERSER